MIPRSNLVFDPRKPLDRRCYFRSVPLPTTLAKLQQETAELMTADVTD